MRTVVIAFLSIIALLIFIFVNIFFNPLGTFYANFRIRSYVSTHFPEFRVGYPSWDWKGGHYDAIATLRDDEDIYFKVVAYAQI